MRKNTSGPRFRALLEAANISTTDFAKFWGTEAQNVHNWYTRGVPAYRMEEVSRLLSVNSDWLKTGEGVKDIPRLHAPASNGDTFDAQAIRGVYTVVNPSDIDLSFFKEAPLPTAAAKPRSSSTRTNPSACPAPTLTNSTSSTPTPSAPT